MLTARNESKVHVFDPVPKAGPRRDKKSLCFLSVQLQLPAISPLIISSPSVCLLIPFIQPLCLLVVLLLLSIRGSPAGLDETEGLSKQAASPTSPDKTEAGQERPQTPDNRF